LGAKKPLFYGWYVVAAALFCYGLGISPAYYSWGFFAPEVVDELSLTRQQVGDVFGIFSLVFSIVAPLVGIAIDRVGVRATVTAGAVVAAVGFFMTSRASTLGELYLSYAVVGGIGIGFSTILPAQTLPVSWFVRYRARATAIILVGGSLVGMVVNPIDELILRHWSWREGWLVISGVSLVVAVAAALFIRNQPEDLGLEPDGRSPGGPLEALATGSGGSAAASDAPGAAPAPARAITTALEEPRWTAAQAIRTPHFLVATFAALANQLPWAIVTAHGRLHLEDLGFTSAMAAGILGVRVGVSTAGRLTGALGDFLSPARLLGLALVVVGAGCGGLVVARSVPLALASVVLLGLGYGAAYISIPVVFGYFFGRRAFAGTSGMRIALLAISAWLGPRWAGAAADATGSYVGTFAFLALLCAAGAAAILLCPRPAGGPAPAPLPSVAS
jgi:MFS family permease